MLDPHLYCCLHARGEYQNHCDSHLCTRFRVDGIKVTSRDTSGGKQNIKFANAINRGRLCLFSQNETAI